nr:FHA domain-containing protein [Mycobacterium sp. BK086]
MTLVLLAAALLTQPSGRLRLPPWWTPALGLLLLAAIVVTIAAAIRRRRFRGHSTRVARCSLSGTSVFSGRVGRRLGVSKWPGPLRIHTQRRTAHVVGHDGQRQGHVPSVAVPPRSSEPSAAVPAQELALVLEDVTYFLPIPLSGARVTVGRASSCDVVVGDPTVSRDHAILERGISGWLVHDNGSNSGTFVNERPVPRAGPPTLVAEGDRVRFGAATYLVVHQSQKPWRGKTSGASATALAPGTNALSTVRFRAAGATSAGDRRHNNDLYAVRPSRIVVADAVGDDSRGMVTAQVLRDQLTGGALTTYPLPELVAHLHSTLQQVGRDERSGELASTVDVIGLSSSAGEPEVEGIHVGDGAVFVAGLDGSVIPLTRAQTMSTNSPVLAHALGHDNTGVNPLRWVRRAVAGERYLITTDGLLDALGSRAISVVTSELRVAPVQRKTPRELADGLVRLALENPVGPRNTLLDNITVVVADIIEEAYGE